MSATSFPAADAVSFKGRHAVIVGGVVLLHGVGLWALDRGLLRPPPELIVPAQILAELIAPPPPPPPQVVPARVPPPPAPAAPAPPSPPKPKPAPPSVKPRPRAAPPQPAPVAQALPTAPVVVPTPSAPIAAEPVPTPVAAPAPPAPAPSPSAPPAPPTPAVVVQPSTQAAHLNNPPPPYPAMSRRLGETGRVMVRVLIGPDGRAQDARIQRSSGYERLDQVALDTARDRWRYVPGTRNGVPEAMWFNVPINFVLE